MQTAALIIFVITYTGIIFTRLPGVNIDRPSAAFFGAVAMMLTGVLSMEEAVQAIDYNTIALLLGMMILIATLQLDGFFSLLAQKTIRWAQNRQRLLIMTVLVTGIASAFLVNDAVVLLFTPVIILICSSAGINPLPYLIAEILASNAGSTMTITGNPQNMLIGINSGIDYGRFLLHLLPVSVMGMAVSVVMVRLIYRSHFRDRSPLQYNGQEFRYDYRPMRFSVPVFLLVVVLFFFGKLLGLSIPLIALLGASLVMLGGHIKPSRIIREVDWVLLLFFAALFIVVRGVEKTGVLDSLIHAGGSADAVTASASLHGLSLLMSQIVSNVPFTVLMLPVMEAQGSDFLWLSLASASTLAGNATIIGAMANLIVIESAASKGVTISFREFLKSGLAVALISLLLSFVILYLQYLAGWLAS